ncbi:MAG: type II toxin-antitoxin system VapC family toxin [Microcystis panniformis]
MLKYLLDSNVCIRYLNARSPFIRQRLQQIDTDKIALCSVVKAELFYGAMKSNNPQQTLAKQQEFLNIFISLPFDDLAAMIYGEIRASLTALGTPIGSNDLQIAAITLAHNLILVTHNTGEFKRIVGLTIEDWETEA